MPRKKAVKNENTEKIIRNYDPFSMEKRIYNLDHAPQRSYDLYSMEKRIHNLEINGGGGGANLTTLNANPTTSSQTITPEAPYDGFNEVNISAVTSSIDENIVAGNIKKDVTILGVTGTYEGNQVIMRQKTDSLNGNATITETGTYYLWTVLAQNHLNSHNFKINNVSANTQINNGYVSGEDPVGQGFGYALYEVDFTAGDVFSWACTYDTRCFIMCKKIGD